MIEKKIKVIFLIGPAIGGIKTYLLSLVSGIDRSRFELYIALPANLHHEFSQVSAELLPVNFKLGFGTVKDIISLVFFVRQKKIDIIHSQGFRASILAYIVSKITKVKTLSTLHTFLFSPMWGKRKTLIYKFIVRFFLNKIDKKIAICDAIFKELVNIGVKSDKITIIYNGIPLPENIPSSNKADFGYKNDDFIVGCISRFAPQKGVEYFIMSIPKILSKYSFVKFLLVGEGPTKEKIIYLVHSLNIKDNIKILPFQKKIDNILKIIDILVVPSISEGLPYLILEAMAQKKAIVATSVGGVPEVIKHKENGYLIPSCNYEAISSAVIYLFENKIERERISLYGRETVEKYFTEELMIKKTEDVLLELFTS